MTIKNFMEKAQELDDTYKPMNKDDKRKYSEMLAEITELWSNAACLGYLRKACSVAKREGIINEEQEKFLINEMKYQFDMMSIPEAEEMY